MNSEDSHQPKDAESRISNLARRGQIVQKLAIGTVLVGGTLELTSWNAQAHGNRSSHGRSRSLLLSPQDYVAMRELNLEPQAADTKLLVDLNRAIATLQAGPLPGGGTAKGASLANLPAVANDKGGTGGAAGGAGPRPNDLAGLLQRRNEVLTRIQMRPIARQVSTMMASGDVNGAKAIIEGGENASKVIETYRWIILDLANTDADFNDLSAQPRQLRSIVEVSAPALEFCNNHIATLSADTTQTLESKVQQEVQIAELLHNISALICPQINTKGVTDPVTLDLARRSSEKALAIRTKHNDPATLLRAYVQQANVLSTQKALSEAKKALERAIEVNETAKENDQLVLIKLSLAKLLETENSTQAGEYLAQAKQLWSSLQPELQQQIAYLKPLLQ